MSDEQKKLTEPNHAIVAFGKFIGKMFMWGAIVSAVAIAAFTLIPAMLTVPTAGAVGLLGQAINGVSNVVIGKAIFMAPIKAAATWTAGVLGKMALYSGGFGLLAGGIIGGILGLMDMPENYKESKAEYDAISRRAVRREQTEQLTQMTIAQQQALLMQQMQQLAAAGPQAPLLGRQQMGQLGMV